MKRYIEITGDLIDLALKGHFDVITHGCNSFCTMGSGIAPHMARNFHCNDYPKESPEYKGDFNKLGQIEYGAHVLESSNDSFEVGANISPEFLKVFEKNGLITTPELRIMYVVNSYTQYHYGTHPDNKSKTLLDYDALRLCLRKINHRFKGKEIGLPLIGCGLAGGIWEIVKIIIQEELKDMSVIIVKLPQ